MTKHIPVRQPLLVRKSPRLVRKSRSPMLFLVYASLASAALGPATAAARTWTDATGKHQAGLGRAIRLRYQ